MGGFPSPEKSSECEPARSRFHRTRKLGIVPRHVRAPRFSRSGRQSGKESLIALRNKLIYKCRHEAPSFALDAAFRPDSPRTGGARKNFRCGRRRNAVENRARKNFLQFFARDCTHITRRGNFRRSGCCLEKRRNFGASKGAIELVEGVFEKNIKRDLYGECF